MQGTSCRARVAYTGTWKVNSTTYAAALQLYLSSQETIPVPYTVVIENEVYTGIQYPWNWENPTYAAQKISGKCVLEWQALGPDQNGPVNIGGPVLGSSTDLLPTKVTVAGRLCEVVQ